MSGLNTHFVHCPWLKQKCINFSLVSETKYVFGWNRVAWSVFGWNKNRSFSVWNSKSTFSFYFIPPHLLGKARQARETDSRDRMRERQRQRQIPTDRETERTTETEQDRNRNPKRKTHTQRTHGQPRRERLREREREIELENLILQGL